MKLEGAESKFRPKLCQPRFCRAAHFVGHRLPLHISFLEPAPNFAFYRRTTPVPHLPSRC